ncbi:MAG: hypothetical protein NTV58_14530 [Deltaproteobacteria bacterium]|nr:hypothetical protein [Deltaproteobacteria bacterium]
MKWVIAIIALILIFASAVSYAECVYIIAPSVSTSIEARTIMSRQGWGECKIRNADAILVVVRSMLFNPLNHSYETVFDLQKDADNQLNIAGENFHVYIYSIDDDLGVAQLKHVNYKAD